MTRAQRKAFVDDDGCNVGIHDRRTEGVLEASDDDRLIDERVDGRRSRCFLFARRRQLVAEMPVTIRVSK